MAKKAKKTAAKKPAKRTTARRNKRFKYKCENGKCKLPGGIIHLGPVGGKVDLVAENTPISIKFRYRRSPFNVLTVKIGKGRTRTLEVMRRGRFKYNQAVCDDCRPRLRAVPPQMIVP